MEALILPLIFALIAVVGIGVIMITSPNPYKTRFIQQEPTKDKGD